MSIDVVSFLTSDIGAIAPLWNRNLTNCINIPQLIIRKLSLQWRHNELDGVSNHQPHYCLLNCLFRRRSKKSPKLRVTGLCAGNLPVTGKFLAQMASNAENISILMTSSCIDTRCSKTLFHSICDKIDPLPIQAWWWNQNLCTTFTVAILILSKPFMRMHLCEVAGVLLRLIKACYRACM